MQTHGFHWEDKAYLDGPFNSVDWANAATLNSAIAHVGPVKIGVAALNPDSPSHGQITSGENGWAVYGLRPGHSQNACASLCGFGPLEALVGLFERNGVSVNLPIGMPSGPSYAMFICGSIGIVDNQSLMNITGEAWVRNPTTIVRTLDG
jgi:hypothetical protein